MRIRWPWAKKYQVRCPDGTTRTIYNDINDVLPLYIKGWKADAGVGFDGLSALKGKAKANYESQIQGILFRIDEQNQSWMMSFRAVYMAFESNPCGNEDFFKRETEKLLDEQRRLTALRRQLSTLIQLAVASPNDTAQITKILSDIASKQGGTVIAAAASLEIAQARADAVELTKGN